jgi:hypothetical protein
MQHTYVRTKGWSKTQRVCENKDMEANVQKKPRNLLAGPYSNLPITWSLIGRFG